MGYTGHTPSVTPETKEALPSLSDELLPCPICGSKVRIEVGRDLEGDDLIRIKCCICLIEDYPDSENQEDRIRERLMYWWNERSTKADRPSA